MQQKLRNSTTASISVLKALSSRDLELLRKYLRLHKVKKGKELFREGSYPKTVFIIKRGKVKLFQRGQNGAETIVQIHSAGEMFGYRPLLCGETYPFSAQTIEDGALYKLSARHFLWALDQSAGLANILLRSLSHEFSQLVNKVSDFAQKSVKERTALSLLMLKEKYRNPDSGGPIEIALSRYDLAAFVGTTIETIARIIRRLREDQVIQTRGRKIIIRDEAALLKLVD